VTQTADVDVNKAVRGLPQVPALKEKGNINEIVPTVITARKPKPIVRDTVMGG
jgi:hypothetical protein